MNSEQSRKINNFAKIKVVGLGGGQPVIEAVAHQPNQVVLVDQRASQRTQRLAVVRAGTGNAAQGTGEIAVVDGGVQ